MFPCGKPSLQYAYFQFSDHRWPDVCLWPVTSGHICHGSVATTLSISTLSIQMVTVQEKADSLPQTQSLVSYAFGNSARHLLCSGHHRPGAGWPPQCDRKRCRSRSYIVQGQEREIFLVLRVSMYLCSRFLRLTTFSINNVSDCSRNWNSHFDGSNRMDFGWYDLAQWSAVDGCLHRPEQRVSLRILSPVYCMYLVFLCAVQAIYGHLSATTLVRSSWYMFSGVLCLGWHFNYLFHRFGTRPPTLALKKCGAAWELDFQPSCLLLSMTL